MNGEATVPRPPYNSVIGMSKWYRMFGIIYNENPFAPLFIHSSVMRVIELPGFDQWATLGEIITDLDLLCSTYTSSDSINSVRKLKFALISHQEKHQLFFEAASGLVDLYPQ